MKITDGTVIKDRPTGRLATSPRIKLAMVVGLGILTFLSAIGFAIQPAQAQELGEPLPDSITVTRGIDNGRKTITFHVNEPHSLFSYYDRINTSWDRSGGNCFKNRTYFEYYSANNRDDTEPIRQSHDYTIHQREEGAQVCIRVIFGDWRDGGGGANPNGPFSFDADQAPVENPPEEEEPEETEVQPPANNQQPEEEPPPESENLLPSQTEASQQPAEALEPEPEPETLPEPEPEPTRREPPEAEAQQDPATTGGNPATEPTAIEQIEATDSSGSFLVRLGVVVIVILALGVGLLMAASRNNRPGS